MLILTLITKNLCKDLMTIFKFHDHLLSHDLFLIPMLNMITSFSFVINSVFHNKFWMSISLEQFYKFDQIIPYSIIHIAFLVNINFPFVQFCFYNGYFSTLPLSSSIIFTDFVFSFTRLRPKIDCNVSKISFAVV